MSGLQVVTRGPGATKLSLDNVSGTSEVTAMTLKKRYAEEMDLHMIIH